MSEEIPFETLQTLTGYTRPGDVEKCLRGQGVTLLRGKDGRPFTTIAALNRAMGLDNTRTKADEEIDF